MKIKDCPRCGGPMGVAESFNSQYLRAPHKMVLQCGELFGPDCDPTKFEERFQDCESNGYPTPCGYEESIPADVEAQLEERPRLFD